MKRVSLFLMSEKGLNCLKELSINTYFLSMIDMVVIGRDKNVRNDFSNDIKLLSDNLNVPSYFRGPEYTLTSDFIIAISWRWIIPIENSTLITIHDSLLPKYRGFAPLVNQLINGEAKIGATAILSSEEYDKGDILAQESVDIEYPIKISKAISLISKVYGSLIINIFNQIKTHQSLIGKPQNGAEATYSLWRNEDDYHIDWKNTSKQIKRFVDSVGFPYKGAKSLINGKWIRINEVEEIDDVEIVNRDVGKIIFFKDKRPIVVCGSGLIKINEAKYDEGGHSIFPLNKFRLKFE